MPEPFRSDISTRRSPAAMLLRGAVAGLLGAAAALLLACGSSGGGLIPAGNAGPLQSDFETIAQAAQSGNGSCAATEAAIIKTEQDFRALPAAVDSGLRDRLNQGITNLRTHALELCNQPLTQPTVTSSTTKSAPTTSTSSTTPTTTDTTPTATTPTTTTPTTTGPGGGTAAPNGGSGEPPAGDQRGKGGGTEPEGSGGAPAGGGQEGGK